MDKYIFEDLFVLELANNHWGNVKRGLKIIEEFGQVVRFNNVRAAIKLQFRDVDNFIHKEFHNNTDIRYIKKTKSTKLSLEEFEILVKAIKETGCIAMATPFDEKSVELCQYFDMPIIKIASSDINDWPLIEKISKTEKPVIVSTGGSSLKDMDDIVNFFNRRKIPLAVNHCVSLYPSEDSELELNQIDFLRERYPNCVIGFSTHEYHDWSASIMIAYAKGARTFERHIDIDMNNVTVSSYCTLPEQADTWFKAYHKAKEMCGAAGTQKRIPSKKETDYLNQLVRGVYAKRDLPKDYKLSQKTMVDDVYLAIPLLKGQLSCRELMSGELLVEDIKKDQAILIDHINTAYDKNSVFKKMIHQRGIAIESK